MWRHAPSVNCVVRPIIRTQRISQLKDLISQAIHDRKAHDDLGLPDGMLHMEGAREFHRFDRRRVEYAVS